MAPTELVESTAGSPMATAAAHYAQAAILLLRHVHHHRLGRRLPTARRQQQQQQVARALIRRSSRWWPWPSWCEAPRPGGGSCRGASAAAGARYMSVRPLKWLADGKYEIGEELGAGGDAVVYKGRNTETKVLDKQHIELAGAGPRMQERLTREIYAMMSVRHPYVTRLHQVCSSETKIYLVMEYMAGGDLHDRVSKMGRLGEDEARRHFQRLIDAVHFCHRRGVCHRDLKPENLLLTAGNEVKVADFGLSAIQEFRLERGGISSTRRRMHSVVGTSGYQAPEVISPTSFAGYTGETADVWSCGVILFVMMAGFEPFSNVDESQGEPTLLQMYDRMVKQEYQCPTYFSPQAQELIAGILQPNVRARITTDEIYGLDWFQTSYVPPEFDQVQHVRADRRAIEEAVMQQQPAWDGEGGDVVPGAMEEDQFGTQQAPSPLRSFNAFDLLAQMTPVDHALAPHFSRLGRDVRIKDETRFSSQLPVAQIVQQVRDAAETLDFVVRTGRPGSFDMVMEERVKHIDREPLAAVAQMFEVLPGLSMVVVQKLRGDPVDYQEFSDGLAVRLKYRGITPIRLNYK